MAKAASGNGLARKRTSDILLFRALDMIAVGVAVAIVLLMIFCVLLEVADSLVGK